MIPTIDSIAREQVARFQQTRYLPDWPPAVQWLNYPHTGPEVGTALGPNEMGEYLTVVSSEGEAGDPLSGRLARIRVGLAYGIVKIAPPLHCVLNPDEHAPHAWTYEPEPGEITHLWCDGSAS